MRTDVRPSRRFNLRKTLFIVPSLITLSSVFCGFYAIKLAAVGDAADDYYRAALLIIFAMFFDMLDGRVARMTKTQTAFGLQIDSLADIVSFGVAPALLVYVWSLKHQPTAGFVASFLFVAAGAVRLARFNVLSMCQDGRPQKPGKYILGLPIPGAAGILISIVVANHAAQGNLSHPTYAWAMCGVTLGLALLMVSNIQFRSFKDLKLNVRTALLVAFAIGSSIVVASQLKPAFVLVWLLGFYIAIGLVESAWNLPKRLRARRESQPPSTPL